MPLPTNGSSLADRQATGERHRRPRRRERVARRLTTDLAYTPSAWVALAGVWLVVSPLAADDRTTYPWWNDVVAGSVIAVLAAVRVAVPENTGALSAITVVLGGWLVAAPFVLGFSGVLGAAWNHIIVGLLVVTMAGVSAITGDGLARARDRKAGERPARGRHVGP